MSARRIVLVTAVLCVLGAAACADPGTGPANPGAASPAAPPAVRADPSVVALVPDDIKARGSLVFATSAPSAPIVFFKEDNKTLTGYTIDLGNAIAATMGLRMDWQNVSFDSMLPGLAGGKYDGAMTSLSIEHERLRSVDFVSYYLSGGGFLIKKGSGIAVNSFEQLCGYRVAVKKGVSQLDALTKTNEHCAAGGKKPIEILQVPTDNALALAMQSDRADVGVADKPQALYMATQSQGNLCVVSTYQTPHSIAGIAVPKGSPLRPALRAAVNSLLKSGGYEQVSRAWGTGAAEAGATLSAEYQQVAAPWGVGPDGVVTESKIFTDPAAIPPGHSRYYYQSVRQGCA